MWGSRVTEVQKVLETCIQCWRRNAANAKSSPLRSLLKGGPGEVAAIDLFNSLSKTETNNIFILVLIDHFSRWVKFMAFKKQK